MSTSYEDDIAVGKPTVQEILQYFSCEGKHNDSSSVPSSSNTSGCSLNESFKEFLQQKTEEKLKSKMNQFENVSEFDDSLDIQIGIMGGDETFTRMERFCDRTLDEPVPIQLDSNDITQLNEINEPSMLWENTIQKMSPVKLCGVLRPSTIMEEDSQDISDLSAKSNRTETTVKDKTTRESSSVYTTASETGSGASSTVQTSLQNLIDFDTPVKKKHYYYDDKGNFISPRSSNGTSNDVSDYVTAASNGKGVEDIIEVLSSDESTEETGSIANTLDDVSSLNEDVGFDPDSLDIKIESPTKSLNFNDTIEEMDYMMKKGMQLLQEKNNLVTLIPTKIPFNSPNSNSPTPSKQICKKRDPITIFKSCNSSKTISSSSDHPLKSFKKPIGSKIPSAKKKGSYDYIVSPIGMYIKNTPTIPLTKTGNSRRDIFESKLAHIRDSTASSNGNESIKQKPETNNSPCPFPRKAYIAAENNHVVDERVNPRIMGGEKVHRLFGGYNRTPTITKHQGRIKITNSSGKKENKSKVDDSFKDLSLISGDVSFQVIKSAKKY